MGILWYLLGILLLISCGYFFLKIFVWKDKLFYKLEFFVLSFLAGIILVSFWMFLMGWIWFDLSFQNIVLLILAINAFLILLNYFLKTQLNFKQVDFITEIKKLKGYQKIIILVWILWICLKLFWWWFDILQVPTYQDDTFGNWNYRWKVFYYQENLVLDNNNDDFLWGWFRQYPMTVSLTKTYLAKFYWEWAEWAVNFISFLFYLSALIILFFAIYRETKSVFWWFLAVYFLSSIPLYHIHWTNPYFDLFQWLYLFVVIYLMYRYMKNFQNKHLLILTLIFIAFLWLTKNEWLSMYLPLMVLGIIFVLLIQKIFLKKSINLTLQDFLKIMPVFMLPAIFIIFKLIYNLWFGNWRNRVSEYPIEYNPDALYAIKIAVFNEWNFNLLWFFLVILVLYFIVVNFRKIKENIGIYIVILFFVWFVLVNILLLTFIKSLHKEAISQIWVNRVFIHIVLLWVFFMVILSYKLLNKKWT